MVRCLRFSNQEKLLLWERWRQGDGLREIARLLERGPSSVSKVLRQTGGIKPALRSRSSSRLSLNDRENISRGLACGKSLRAIAQEINRSPSTVSREVKRNGGSVRYRATGADQATWPLLLASHLVATVPTSKTSVGLKVESQ